MTDDVMMTVHASAPRRMFAVATLVTLGAMLVWLAIARPPEAFALQAFLVIFGLFALWAAERLRRSTGRTLQLTETELRDDEGTVLARVEDIVSLDRGVFAWKPSNGFLLRLVSPGAARWEPGMWWRIGRRIGVGGVVAAPQAKAMAEILSAMIAARDD